MTSADGAAIDDALTSEGIDEALLFAALRIKGVVGQIDVMIHAVGILVSLPYILDPTERVESLSLGAGNTGKDFDLETNKRVAEFKFIRWRGGSESIRQNQLFYDLFKLAEQETARRRCLYVIGKEHPLRFLNGRRALSSVLTKNQAIRDRFREKYGDRFAVASDYYDHVKDLVELCDLREAVPAFSD